jgi:cytochrome d ubiquinol oxidase subunit II
LYNAIPFVVFFLAFVISILLSEGFAVQEDGTVYMEKYKYFNNFIDMPVVGVLFLLGVVAVLYGIIASILKQSFKKGIWYTGAGTVVTVTMLLLIAGYNNTSFYPSSTDLQSSLTIFNASSSEFTLKAMSWASILVPIVAGYIFIAWRALEKKKTDMDDINSDSHAY